MLLPPLYHWSPRSRAASIRRLGLVPGKRPTIGTTRTVTDGRYMVCLAPDPAAAWSLSGAIWARELGVVWDLWQAHLVDTDEVHVRPDFGPRIVEVRVANRIPKRRLVWLAERS